MWRAWLSSLRRTKGAAATLPPARTRSNRRKWLVPPRVKLPILPLAMSKFSQKANEPDASVRELATIIERTTRGVTIEPEKVMDGSEIIKWQKLIRDVILAQHVQDYIVRLVLATHPEGQFALPITNQYLRWGSSPRGAQTLALAAKVRALLDAEVELGLIANMSMAYILERLEGDRTRLISRVRVHIQGALALPYIYLIYEWVNFVMQRRQLLGIKTRPEA